MKEERVFLGLSIILFVVLGAVLFVSVAGAMPPATLPAAPLLLAPRMPTPTPAPLPPDYSPPDMSGIDALTDWPDLFVESITVEPARPEALKQATIEVTIGNRGPGVVTATNNFYVDLYIGSAGVPASGERGLTCSGNCSYSVAGLTVLNSVLPWGCQGWWVSAVDSRYVLTATVVFSEVKSYYLYAQIDTPEVGALYGRVYEGSAGGERNNIYPTDSSVWVQVSAARFTQSTHQDFYDNYAASLEVVPYVKSFTDIDDVLITSTSALVLGLFEEPPVFWGTTTITPGNPTYTNYYTDYNVLEPDSSVYLSPQGAREPDTYSLNSVHTYNQSNPIVATDGVAGSHRVVAVWQDNRYNIEKPAIFLRWSDSEVNMDGGAFSPDTFVRQDWGDAATHEMRVNNDAGGGVPPGYALNPSVAVAPNGVVVVIWQDNRLNPTAPDYWDIYYQQYQFVGNTLTTSVWSNERVLTEVCPDASETHPDISVDESGTFYVVWQSQCTKQTALWAAKSCEGTAPGEIAWCARRYVSDPSAHERRDPRIDTRVIRTIEDVQYHCTSTSPYYVVDSIVTEATTETTAVWVEDRGLVTDDGVPTGNDIWFSVNHDGLCGPFGEDQTVNDDTPTAEYMNKQDQPATAVSQVLSDYSFIVECPLYSGTVTLENQPTGADLHIAWRDFRNSTGADPDPSFPGNDPDIYYQLFDMDGSKVGDNVKMNTDDTGSPTFDWQTAPPKQLDPDVADGGYVVWADGRNYDNRNFDIYVALPGGTNYNLNDHAKLHAFATWAFDDYSLDRPPAAWQVQPSIALSPNPYPYIYVAWADNRLSAVDSDDQNDIFFSRSSYSYAANYDVHDYGPECGDFVRAKGHGAFISKAFDSCPGIPDGSPDCDTTWYKLDYGGIMPEETWISLQTRVADTVPDLLAADWWPQDLLWASRCGYAIPIRGYLGPGSYIEQNGAIWPKGRYAQYRVNMWAMPDELGFIQTPTLYYVTLFYGTEGGSNQWTDHQAYLPVIFKDSP